MLLVAAKFSKLSAKFIQYRPGREWRRMLKFEILDSHFSTEEGLILKIFQQFYLALYISNENKTLEDQMQDCNKAT